MDVLTLMGHGANLFGFLGGLFGFLAWVNTRIIKREARKARAEQARLEEPISIRLKLKEDGRSVSLPFRLRRKELTRAELQGLLGVLPIQNELKTLRQPRYRLDYLSTPDYLAQLENVRSSESVREIVIDCSKDEFNQFDFSRFSG